MSGAQTSNLSREKIRQLLAAIGSKPSQDITQMETTEYDWHQPHYFNSDQLNRLNDFTKEAAVQLSEKFTQLTHSDFNVTIDSITLHFASELFIKISASGQSDYYLAFGSDQKKLFGLVGIPMQTAITLVSFLLGEKPSADQVSKIDAGLSQLEESLLFDIAQVYVKSFSTSLSAVGGTLADYKFHPAKTIVRGKLPIELGSRGAGSLRGIEEICKIVLSIEKAGAVNSGPPEASSAGTQAYILIPCSRLAPLVGKITEADNKLSAQDISKAILNHLERMPVSITAQLGATVLTLEQIMSLRPGDILLLDKAIDDRIELIVEGRTIFRGQPAKLAGHHAVVIQNTEDRIQNIEDRGQNTEF